MIKFKFSRIYIFGFLILFLFTTHLWGEVKPGKKISKGSPSLACKDHIRFAASFHAGTDIPSRSHVYHFKLWTNGLFEVFERSGWAEIEITVKGKLEEAQMALLFSKLEAAQFFSLPEEKAAPASDFLGISINWSMSYCKDGKTKTIQNVQRAKPLMDEIASFFRKQLEDRNIKTNIE